MYNTLNKNIDKYKKVHYNKNKKGENYDYS